MASLLHEKPDATVSTKPWELQISFSERVLARMAEAADDPFHNFPTSFAEYILKYGGIGISGTRYIQYEIPGVINGRNGVYQVGGHWIGNVFEITHWFFKPF